jgi:hexosaminidase
MLAAVFAIVTLHLVPRPASIHFLSCAPTGTPFPLRVSRGVDPGALEILNERWSALGIGAARVASEPQLRLLRDARLPPQAYRLTVKPSGTIVESSDAAGAFYAMTTLSQLPLQNANRWTLPCVQISDRPAMRWRILSDDVSRGPLPTMRYFEERIRTIASFKMNGYSPYMENTFVSPTDPLPAPLDGITPFELETLAAYAARFHVALIPEQQTLAHMHGTLRVEAYASATQLPHGFLLSPDSPLTLPYLSRIIGQELGAVPHAPFFHIGSDEANVAPDVWAAHVEQMARIVAPSGARIMVWDDALQANPSLVNRIPKTAVVVSWHYAALPTYEPFLQTIARGGRSQMVDPGASNWNEIFPDVNKAIAANRTFIDEAKAAHALGLFQSVWHDDGETLYETTWYPVLYSAAAAWEADDVDPQRFRADFPAAFFGVDDRRYGDDVDALASIESALGGTTDRLFWADPFDQFIAARIAKIALRSMRLRAESVETHLYSAQPPLHANAAHVMLLAARRFDALGRRYQIASEVRQYYSDAQTHPDNAIRDLFWCKYWFWEQRDADETLAPLYAKAWRYESRGGHLASNLERYHLDAQLAIRRADAVDRATYESYVPNKTLPPLSDVLDQR